VTGRVRVLYVCHTLSVGGAEELMLHVLGHLPRDRWEPAMCCIAAEGPLGSEFRAAGHRLLSLGRVPGFRDPLAVLEVARAIRRLRPHIVHTFLLTGNLYGRLAALLARVPVVISTEVNVHTGRKARHLVAERLLARRTDAMVASAESVKAQYLRDVGRAAPPVEVIYSAVDWRQIASATPRAKLRAEWGFDPGVPVAGVIARLTEQKGHEHLLEALARTPELHDLALVVVGDGPRRPALEAQARALGLGPRVRFAGTRRDLGDVLAALDVFVLPSLTEGFPTVILEAMAFSLPAVVTDVGGCSEAVETGASGFVVPAADPRALGNAMGMLLMDGALRKAMGARGRARVVGTFSVPQLTAAVFRAYAELSEEFQAGKEEAGVRRQ
jgi:glycosyltransferase involved in cell wall biosynthesis